MRKPNKIKLLLAQYGKKIGQKRLVMGAMGNISLRGSARGEVAWIKRSGVWLERAEPGDFLRVNIRHPEPKITKKISKEINLHLGCFRARPDINAVIHTHPFVTTGLGTVQAKMGRKRADFGGKVAIIKYYQPGSKALANVVSKAIKKADSVVMANHGLVVVGRSLKEAYERTLGLERKAGRLLMRAL